MIETKLRTIVKSTIGITMSGRYANSLVINGFIIQKPKQGYNKKGYSFIIHQPQYDEQGVLVDTSFNIVAYAKSTIDIIEKIDHVCFISCWCKLVWNYRMKTAYGQLVKCEINCELDEELLPPYQKESK